MNKDQSQRIAFERMIDGEKMSMNSIIRLTMNSFFDPFRFVLANMPGPSGYALRRLIYKSQFKSLGKNCILDVGMKIVSPKNISVNEYTWIDSYTSINALFGSITIGKRVHIGSFSIIGAGKEGLVINDYVGVGAGCRIYGHSEIQKDGKRMSGPMIPWRYKAYHSGPVVLEKDSVLGTNSVVLPGVTIGEGAVVSPGSVITKDIPPWVIAAGVPTRFIGKREKVSVPDL
tara:strand:+ start:4280 stop:4969 length:690 start_codon:yes stop_codon:yes gene_type:complete